MSVSPKTISAHNLMYGSRHVEHLMLSCLLVLSYENRHVCVMWSEKLARYAIERTLVYIGNRHHILAADRASLGIMFGKLAHETSVPLHALENDLVTALGVHCHKSHKVTKGVKAPAQSYI